MSVRLGPGSLGVAITWCGWGPRRNYDIVVTFPVGERIYVHDRERKRWDGRGQEGEVVEPSCIGISPNLGL